MSSNYDPLILKYLLGDLGISPQPAVPLPVSTPAIDFSRILPTVSPTPSQPTLRASAARIVAGLSQVDDTDITDGRILPSLEAIQIASGRKLKAAVLYNDLKGFSRLVATTPKKKVLKMLHAFVSEMARTAPDFGGEVVDCAGDRIMAVFWRPHKNDDRQPIYDALSCAFWMQTIIDRGLKPILARKGLPTISCGIGIDYGQIVVTRVGIRNRNKLVLLGDAANSAAKLEDLAEEGQTIVSPIVYANRPPFMMGNGWAFEPYPDRNVPAWYISRCVFQNDMPHREFVKRRI